MERQDALSNYETELYFKSVRGRALAIKDFAVLLFRTVRERGLPTFPKKVGRISKMKLYGRRVWWVGWVVKRLSSLVFALIRTALRPSLSLLFPDLIVRKR